jgi:hypothetical protein
MEAVTNLRVFTTDQRMMAFNQEQFPADWFHSWSYLPFRRCGATSPDYVAPLWEPGNDYESLFRDLAEDITQSKYSMLFLPFNVSKLHKFCIIAHKDSRTLMVYDFFYPGNGNTPTGASVAIQFHQKVAQMFMGYLADAWTRFGQEPIIWSVTWPITKLAEFHNEDLGALVAMAAWLCLYIRRPPNLSEFAMQSLRPFRCWMAQSIVDNRIWLPSTGDQLLELVLPYWKPFTNSAWGPLWSHVGPVGLDTGRVWHPLAKQPLSTHKEDGREPSGDPSNGTSNTAGDTIHESELVATPPPKPPRSPVLRSNRHWSTVPEGLEVASALLPEKAAFITAIMRQPMSDVDKQKVLVQRKKRKSRLEDIVSFLKLGSDTVSRKNFKTLEDETWVDDAVINHFGKLLTTKTESTENIGFFRSQFYAHLMNVGPDGKFRGYSYKKVENWSKNMLMLKGKSSRLWMMLMIYCISISDAHANFHPLFTVENTTIFDYDCIFIPVNIPKLHWCLVVVWPKKKEIECFDSTTKDSNDRTIMRDGGHAIMENILTYLLDEHGKLYHGKFRRRDWTKTKSDINVVPQQDNGKPETHLPFQFNNLQPNCANTFPFWI